MDIFGPPTYVPRLVNEVCERPITGFNEQNFLLQTLIIAINSLENLLPLLLKIYAWIFHKNYKNDEKRLDFLGRNSA